MTRSPRTRALDAVRRIVGALLTTARDLEQHARITPAQRFILEQLADGPLPSVNALALRTHTTQATVVVVLNRLQQRGLVERTPDPADRRRTRVSLTRAGQRLLARSAAPAQSHLVAALDAMPPRRVRALADALDGWVDDAGLADRPALLFLEPADARPRTRRA